MLPDLTQYLWIAWLVLAVLFVIIELLTLEFTLLMLGAGTLIGGLGARVVAPFVDGAGSVKLDNGETWTARLVGDGAGVDVGARVVVQAVRGATVDVVVERKADSD